MTLYIYMTIYMTIIYIWLYIYIYDYIYRYDYNIYIYDYNIYIYIHEKHIYIYIYYYICTSPYLHVYSEIKATNSKRSEATQKGYCPASTPDSPDDRLPGVKLLVGAGLRCFNSLRILILSHTWCSTRLNPLFLHSQPMTYVLAKKKIKKQHKNSWCFNQDVPRSSVLYSLCHQPRLVIPEAEDVPGSRDLKKEWKGLKGM